MANDVFDFIEPEELIALDMLHDASQHIAAQFDVRMTRAEAKASLEARAIIFGLCNRIFKTHGCGISREEIEGETILERINSEQIEPKGKSVWLVELEGLTFWKHPDGQFVTCTFTDPKALKCATWEEARYLHTEILNAAPWARDRLTVAEHIFS